VLTFELKFFSRFEIENMISHGSSWVMFDQQFLYSISFTQSAHGFGEMEWRERDIRASPLHSER